MSGTSNVVYYLTARRLPKTPEVVQAVMRAAKNSSKVLKEEEIRDIVRRVVKSNTSTEAAPSRK